MSNFIPDKNYWCRICGTPELIEPHQKHHIIPKTINGTDMDGRIILCKKCHDMLHYTYPKILWYYIDKKDDAKIAIKKYVQSKVKYVQYPKTAN